MCKFAIALLATLCLLVTTMPAYTAVSQHKHDKHTSKERLKDGVYSARDAHHQEGGEHNVEFDHEAIIGSVKEAEEFDSLSPEESKRRLAILIKMMDRNKDGFVDRHELKYWILLSFEKLSKEEAEERFEELDQNNDNVISWKEYVKSSYDMEEEELINDNTIEDDNYVETLKILNDDKEMYKAADSNQDNVLSFEEYVLFHTPEEHAQMLPTVYEQTIRDKDRNGDGVIDFQEFVGNQSHDHDKEWLITEKDRFDQYDNHPKDGILSGDEVLGWVVPNNKEVANDEVIHLFAAADDNHDDRLSYEEILAKYDIFVGSEATDYGEHLENINRLIDEL